MDAIDTIRAFYILTMCTILVVNSIPSLYSRFMEYGARTVAVSSTHLDYKASAKREGSILDYLASWTVPHRFFTHFYVVSVFASIIWGIQLLSRGPAFTAVAETVSEEHRQKFIPAQRIILCCVLMAVQGSRRLFECITFSKQSAARMWFGHWLLGIVFYVVTSVAAWIEGTETILSADLKLDDLRITTVPSIRTVLCVPLFLLASGFQHDCHYYLASQKTYTLPSHPLFLTIVCPHYTAECVIYATLAFLGAPEGEIVNKTLLSCLLLVVVNLGITAAGTKKWYIRKFGEERVFGRWRMIPGVY